MRNSFQILFLSFLFLFSACKKVETPNEEAKKVFGSWVYRYNTGGMSGAGGSQRFIEGQWLEFTDKGKLLIFEGSKKINKFRFKIEMKKSIYGGERPALIYENGVYETYQVQGDQLMISDEHYDGFAFVFERK